MKTGTIKWFNPQRGYGYVTPDDGTDDAFVHVSALGIAGITSVSQGQRIKFDLHDGRGKGPRAINLKLVPA
jgi:cold shock protein